MPGRKWTEEEKDYLREVTPGHHYNEIVDLMNKRFKERNFTDSQIKGAISRYKLNTGFTGRFDKGHIPSNKGKKGFCHKGSQKGWFKKGQDPINYRPVGSERTNVYGYIEIKIDDPDKWRLKHQVIWEEHNGKIPKGYSVIFADRDKTNLSINNLILVSRAELLTMNRHGLIRENSEITKTGVAIADLYLKIGERKREHAKSNKSLWKRLR